MMVLIRGIPVQCGSKHTYGRPLTAWPELRRGCFPRCRRVTRCRVRRLRRQVPHCKLSAPHVWVPWAPIESLQWNGIFSARQHKVRVYCHHRGVRGISPSRRPCIRTYGDREYAVDGQTRRCRSFESCVFSTCGPWQKLVTCVGDQPQWASQSSMEVSMMQHLNKQSVWHSEWHR